MTIIIIIKSLWSDLDSSSKCAILVVESNLIVNGLQLWEPDVQRREDWVYGSFNNCNDTLKLVKNASLIFLNSDVVGGHIELFQIDIADSQVDKLGSVDLEAEQDVEV